MLDSFLAVFASFSQWGTAAGAASLAAFAASGHCALMCGPLACAGARTSSVPRWQLTLAWNGGRVFAYGLVGALLGALGDAAVVLISRKLAPVLPWLMAAGLLVAAFDLGRRLRLPPWLAQGAHAMLRRGAGFSPLISRFVAGAATPLLPCGVLWGGYLAALGTGSALGGALVMGAFALGALPAFALLQSQQARLARWPRLDKVLRRGVPLLGAALLVWRALQAGSEVPSCH